MEVKRTGYSNSIKASLHYIYYGNYRFSSNSFNKPHPNSNGVHHRNEFIAGVGMPGGLSDDAFNLNLKYFNYLINQRPAKRIQATCLVLSFARSDFDFKNELDVLNAVRIGRKFFNKAYCSGNQNHIGIIAAQHDGKAGLPHLHLLVCHLDTNTLKSIPNKTNDLIRLRRIGNRIISIYNQHHHHKLIVMPQARDYDLANRAERLVIHRLRPVVNDRTITSRTRFVKRCHQHGVHAVFRNPGDVRRINKKHVRRYRYRCLLFRLIPPPNRHYRSRYDGRYFPSSKIGYFDKKLRLSRIINMIKDNQSYARQDSNQFSKDDYAKDSNQKGSLNHEPKSKTSIAIERATERTSSTLTQSHLQPSITQRTAGVIDKTVKDTVQAGARVFKAFCIDSFKAIKRVIQRKIAKAKSVITEEARKIEIKVLNGRREPDASSSRASYEQPIRNERSSRINSSFSDDTIDDFNKSNDKSFGNSPNKSDNSPSTGGPSL